MYTGWVRTLQKRANKELTAIQMHQRAMAEQLVAKLDDVLAILVEEKEDPPAGRRIRALLAPDGSLERLRDDCAAIRLSGGSNHLPLLWRFFASHRRSEEHTSELQSLMRISSAVFCLKTTNTLTTN